MSESQHPSNDRDMIIYKCTHPKNKKQLNWTIIQSVNIWVTFQNSFFYCGNSKYTWLVLLFPNVFPNSLDFCDCSSKTGMRHMQKLLVTLVRGWDKRQQTENAREKVAASDKTQQTTGTCRTGCLLLPMDTCTPSLFQGDRPTLWRIWGNNLYVRDRCRGSSTFSLKLCSSASFWVAYRCILHTMVTLSHWGRLWDVVEDVCSKFGLLNYIFGSKSSASCSLETWAVSAVKHKMLMLFNESSHAWWGGGANAGKCWRHALSCPFASFWAWLHKSFNQIVCILYCWQVSHLSVT